MMILGLCRRTVCPEGTQVEWLVMVAELGPRRDFVLGSVHHTTLSCHVRSRSSLPTFDGSMESNVRWRSLHSAGALGKPGSSAIRDGNISILGDLQSERKSAQS